MATCIRLSLATLCVALASAAFCANGKTEYRDAMGRLQGTAKTGSYGKTEYRDAQGRLRGTAKTNSYGKTEYRDAQGRLQGTKR